MQIFCFPVQYKVTEDAREIKCDFGFCTCMDEVLVLLGCVAMSLGIWFLMFWDSIVGLIFEAHGVLMTV